MFASIFLNEISVGLVLAMLGVSLACGIVMALIGSIKLRTNKGVFLTVAMLPLIVSISFLALNVLVRKVNEFSAIAAIGSVVVGLGLIRFRSAQAKAEELLFLFASVVAGALCGLGYLAFAGIFAIVFPAIYVLISTFNIFKNKKFAEEKLLKITIPESLEYSDAFTETFEHYLKEVEMVGVKTTGMGSMFRLSYRIVMKDNREEKEMIDELRIKNGNLEISVLPFVDESRNI